MFAKLYNVYVHPGHADPMESAEFVPEGFSLAAFILTGLWTLFHRLWLVTLLVIGINGLLTYAAEHHQLGVAMTAYVTVLQLGLSVLVGCCGNDWRCRKLENKGYRWVDVVAGDSLLLAQQRFYDRYLAGRPLAPVRRAELTRLERLRERLQRRGRPA